MGVPADLRRSCAATRWQQLVARAWPYRTTQELLAASDRAFDALSREDWLEAFAAHSPIGAPRGGDTLGAAEQSGATGAPEVLDALRRGGADYERRFGFVFLIRARGRSAEEMLGELRRRLRNAPEIEFATACEQQREITRLRLGEPDGAERGAA